MNPPPTTAAALPVVLVPVEPGLVVEPAAFTVDSVGGPVPGFWLWLATTLLAVPAALIAWHTAGVLAVVLVGAAYLGVNVALTAVTR